MPDEKTCIVCGARAEDVCELCQEAVSLFDYTVTALKNISSGEDVIVEDVGCLA